MMKKPNKLTQNTDERRSNLIWFLRTYYPGLRPTEAAKMLDDDLFALYREEPMPWGVKNALYERRGVEP